MRSGTTLCVCSSNGYAKTGDGEGAERWAAVAQRTRRSFNRRFWNEGAGCLYDVVDGEQGDDASCRPNQVFAISLPFAVLDQSRWQPTLDVVAREAAHAVRSALAVAGLARLSVALRRRHPRARCGLSSRHGMGMADWPVRRRVAENASARTRDAARGFLDAFPEHLSEACVGSISEIFDAEAPYAPRGCIAQAWSVAEVLRAWVKTRGP